MRMAVFERFSFVAVPASVVDKAWKPTRSHQFHSQRESSYLSFEHRCWRRVLGNRSNGSLLGIDSLPNWSSYFYFPEWIRTAIRSSPGSTRWWACSVRPGQ